MAGRKRHGLPVDLSRAVARFEQWRQTRVLGERIPEKLWKLAADVAKRHGVSRTAEVLRLDYYGLKKRVAGGQPGVAAENLSPATAFVELPAASLSQPAMCEIEYSDAAGASLRIRLPAKEIPDLVAIGRSFWERR
jgi:hypothetical protein